MLLQLIIILLAVKRNSCYHHNVNRLNSSPFSSSLFVPHHVCIQHIGIDTHSDVVTDVQTPNFSWQLPDEYDSDAHLISRIEQVAYHSVVTDFINNQLMWDSDRVHSSISTSTIYKGKSRKSNTHYTVTIKYYTAKYESKWYSTDVNTEFFAQTE
ncbi:unnamed protein product [Rotaria magnacalcarata]|nr:unnamed protein product [Rotaria magnacalcarata]CAF2123190.1 unnamed protein product [Rotaria magnacalcarata]CAF2152685.1 unnamed protein product [Rotaria magnacalcarata]